VDPIESYRLIGKRAIACGSTQGIGLACARQFARLGAAVTLVARDEAALARCVSELSTDEGQRHDYVVADFDDPASVARRVSEHIANAGPAHILLNNSGGPPSGPVTAAAADAFTAAFGRLLLCSHLLAQTVLAGMKAEGYGRVITIISTSVKIPIAGLGVSNTIRAAVANWARTWAVEVAPFGITVNNVLPGYTATARLDELINAKATSAGKSPEQVRQDMISRIPVGRLGRPEEIAAAAGFLASPAASFITGADIVVDGGRTAAM
jgi:3-oxoacyl-[acyl-carrier protein] reductase